MSALVSLIHLCTVQGKIWSRRSWYQLYEHGSRVKTGLPADENFDVLGEQVLQSMALLQASLWMWSCKGARTGLEGRYNGAFLWVERQDLLFSTLWSWQSRTWWVSMFMFHCAYSILALSPLSFSSARRRKFFLCRGAWKNKTLVDLFRSMRC